MGQDQCQPHCWQTQPDYQAHPSCQSLSLIPQHLSCRCVGHRDTSDAEIHPVVSLHITQASKGQLGVKRFECFSSLSCLIRAVACLLHTAHFFAHSTEEDSCKEWHLCKKGSTSEDQKKARRLVIKSVQHEAYSEEIKCISEKRNLATHCRIKKLNSIIDSDRLLSVGEHISQSQLALSEINPLIVPGYHYLASLIIRHHHEMVKHQGRDFTEGAIQADRLQLVGGKRCIQYTIFTSFGARSNSSRCHIYQLKGCTQHPLSLTLALTSLDPGRFLHGTLGEVMQTARGGQCCSHVCA